MFETSSITNKGNKTMKLKMKKGKKIRQEERGDTWDETYGIEALKSLTRGVIAEMEKNGELPDDMYDGDEVLDEVEVSDEEKYRKAKQINALNKAIEVRLAKVKELDGVIAQRQCKEPSTGDLLRFCNTVNKVSKGKGMAKDK